MKKRILIIAAFALSILVVAASQVYAASSRNVSMDRHVTVKSLVVNKGNVQAELCMTMPTLEDWNPYVTLTVDGKVIPNSEVALINYKDPAVLTTMNRCYLFTFPVSVAKSNSHKGTLKLQKIWLELGRGQLTDSVVSEVRSRVHQSQPLIDFKVVVTAGKNGSGATIEILSKPANMTDKQVMQLIQQASIDTLPGNWQATVNLK